MRAKTLNHLFWGTILVTFQPPQQPHQDQIQSVALVLPSDSISDQIYIYGPQAFYGVRPPNNNRNNNNNNHGNRNNSRGNNKNRGRGNGRQFDWASTQNTVYDTCNRCGIGHIPSQCPIRDPSTIRTRPSANFANTCAQSSNASANWHSDTEANSHVTPDLEAMDNLEAYYGDDALHVGNGKGLSILHIGSSKVYSPQKIFSLKNVLHVPEISHNLRFVQKFCHDNDTTSIPTPPPPTPPPPPLITRQRSANLCQNPKQRVPNPFSNHAIVLPTTITKPTLFTVANNFSEWRQVMKKEYDALMKNGMWSLVPRASNTNVVDGKWVYRLKRDKNGDVTHYKARFVAKGFRQQSENNTKKNRQIIISHNNNHHYVCADAQLKALIDQDVANALAARDANRNRNGEDSHDSGMSGRRQAPPARECTYQDFMKYKPIYFKGTEGVVELTQWMFPKESDKIERYIGGLPDMIYESVMAFKPKTMQDVIEFTTELMDKKINTFAEHQTKNKKKQDDNHSKKTRGRTLAGPMLLDLRRSSHIGDLSHCVINETITMMFCVLSNATSETELAIWPVTVGVLLLLTIRETSLAMNVGIKGTTRANAQI
nr:putative ribonuclease H-like domain-containing protein [Tanacetum cinerariifolium]